MVQLCGLYAIADTGLIPSDRLLDKVSEAVQGGARVIQLRDKDTIGTQRHALAVMLKELCHEHDALFIINDDVELARTAAADGVHLGRGDTSLEQARSVLGSRSIIGISCYNQWERALAAVEGGADYVAFGRFYPSQTKPHAVLADTQLLRDGRAQLRIPVVAIGGITPDNGSPLIEAGAHMLAAIHGVFGQIDTRAAAEGYAKLFQCD